MLAVNVNHVVQKKKRQYHSSFFHWYVAVLSINLRREGKAVYFCLAHFFRMLVLFCSHFVRVVNFSSTAEELDKVEVLEPPVLSRASYKSFFGIVDRTPSAASRYVYCSDEYGTSVEQIGAKM